MRLEKVKDKCYVNVDHITHIEYVERIMDWIIYLDVPFFGPGGQGYGQHGIVVTEAEAMNLIAVLRGSPL